jgi:hypothetical protein
MSLYVKLKNENLIPNYDLQCLFSYYAYYENKEHDMNILGKNKYIDRIYGTSVWDIGGKTHGTIHGLRDMYWNNNKLYSNYYPEKQIDVISFTFYSLKNLWNLPDFDNKLFNI